MRAFSSADVEGLDQVVVGPRVQAVDPVGHGVARGEHQHRHPVARGAQAPAHLEAVEVGHAHVEHHGVGQRLSHLGQALLAARRP